VPLFLSRQHLDRLQALQPAPAMRQTSDAAQDCQMTIDVRGGITRLQADVREFARYFSDCLERAGFGVLAQHVDAVAQILLPGLQALSGWKPLVDRLV